MINRIQRDYSQMIHLMKYAKPYPDGEREDWSESVDRLIHWLHKQRKLPDEAIDYLWGPVMDQVLYQRVMPSMRLLSSAGLAADRENLTAFNCMFLGIDSLEAFGRLMYALMCGTGVGFSVEKIYLDKLPELPDELEPVDDIIRVLDTRLSWVRATICYLEYLFDGKSPKVDYSRIRPKGAPLVTTGGYASGPEPLKELHDFMFDVINQGGVRLSSLEVYDICCKIADVVVQGGVRRSATICLFDWDDVDMLLSKKPENATRNPWRYNSNNTAVFTDESDAKAMLPLILNLAKRTGEPGILMKSTLQRRMKDSLRLPKDTIGLNP
jgi:ribonucleoside-triphosphate reductase (thioredoxin)